MMSATWPMANVHFDDLKPGDRFSLGSREITRESVIRFASQYDPQPMHLSDEGAAGHPFVDRMFSSGWQTVMEMNLAISDLMHNSPLRGLAGGGVQEITWHEPVYPGDTLDGMMEVVQARASKTRPERGILTMRLTMHNQHGNLAASMTITGIYDREGKPYEHSA